METTQEEKYFSIGDIPLKIKTFPNVAEPSAGYTEFLLENLVGKGTTALDLGCGTGILAIALAKRGFKQVYATDLHEDYIAATQYNAYFNGVSEQIIALKSDLFEGIPQGIRFDFIVANLPSTPAWEKIPLYSRAGEDGRGAIDRMLHQAPNWLNPSGTIQFTSSSPISQTVKCKQHYYFELYPEYFQELLSANRVYIDNGTIFEWVYIFQARLKIC
jgi:release factor glutamine methyltransferase